MSWPVRPVLWFVTGSMWITILHEFAHALVALALGVRSTLFNYSANLDLTVEQAASHLPAMIRAAGPMFCLGVGLLSLLAYKRFRASAVELPLLFLCVFGIGTFFGNLMSRTSVAFPARSASSCCL